MNDDCRAHGPDVRSAWTVLFVNEATAYDLCGSELTAFHLCENTLSCLTSMYGLLAPTGPLL